MKREVPVGVVLSALALLVMLSISFLAPHIGKAAQESAAEASAQVAAERAGKVADGVEVTTGDRVHNHELPTTAPHWYATVHGEEGALAQVFALDGTGRVIGPVLGPLPAKDQPMSELRGITMLANSMLAVVSAKSLNTRVLIFGEPDKNTGIRPYRATWVTGGEKNPAMVHAYQIAIGPDGALYASNQDTNTITRYKGLGQSEPGSPLPVASGLAAFGTMPPGTVVPNSQSSPEGLGLVRGFAFGPDGLLYVCDRGRMRVAAYDPVTGRLVREVMTASQGLQHPIQLLFSDDSRFLFITDNKVNCVWRMDLVTGNANQFVEANAGGLKAPSSLALQDHVLYVGNRLGKQILKYDAKNGNFLGVFSELPSNPEFFIPISQQ